MTAEPSEWNVYYVDPALGGTGRDGDGTGRDGTGRDGTGTGPGRDGDGTGPGTGRDGTGRDGTGVVAGWEVLGDEVDLKNLPDETFGRPSAIVAVVQPSEWLLKNFGEEINCGT